jgi:putative flippase GtrA
VVDALNGCDLCLDARSAVHGRYSVARPYQSGTTIIENEAEPTVQVRTVTPGYPRDPIDVGVGVDPTPPAGMSGFKGPLFRLVRDQRVAFLLVGLANTVIGTAWFVIFQLLLQRWIGYMGVLLCAHVAAVLCAFVLYRTFVFVVHGHVLRDLVRFEVVNLTALGVNAVLLPLLVELAHWPVLVAQVSIVGVTVVVSFFGHRGFSFRRSDADHRRSAERASGKDLRPPTTGSGVA